jgi:hypothetical protein
MNKLAPFASESVNGMRIDWDVVLTLQTGPC